jgi:hypothetical protein
MIEFGGADNLRSIPLEEIMTSTYVSRNGQYCPTSSVEQLNHLKATLEFRQFLIAVFTLKGKQIVHLIIPSKQKNTECAIKYVYAPL